MAKVSWTLGLGLLLGVALSCTTALADATYDAGVNLYTAKNYRAAAQQFERSMQTSPGNLNAIYYCALSHYSSNNTGRARQLFQYLSDNAAKTQQGQMARSVLARMPGATASSGGSGITTVTPAGSAGGDDDGDDTPANSGTWTERWLKSHSTAAETASLPALVKIPFSKDRNGSIFIEVMLNGQPVSMVVDTGAPVTCVGDNHLAQLGLSRPGREKQSMLTGVGDRKSATEWTQKCDLKCGSIYRKDFPIVVQDHLPTDGLIGQTFFAPFNVTIDNQNSQLVLKKKGVATNRPQQSRTAWDVPFRWHGGHMIVDTHVNGKPIEMIFDTGADGVSFTMAHMKKLNMQIPADYRKERHTGTGGETMGYGFQIDSIKLGPIVQYSPWVSVVEGSNMDRPLLGQSFYGDYTYQIDTENKLIHFNKQ
jgi:clan AA aspartic protease (TIGR02281 family)